MMNICKNMSKFINFSYKLGCKPKDNLFKLNRSLFIKYSKFNFARENSIDTESCKAIVKRLNTQFDIIKNSNYKESEIIKLLKTMDDWTDDIQDNLVVIDQLQMNFFEIGSHLIYNNIINEKNANQILPFFIKSLYNFKIGDNVLWDKIQEIYFNNLENIELSSHLEILNYTIDLFKSHITDKSERADKFKQGFFDFILAFEMRDYLNLKLSRIILFLGIYSDSFNKNHDELLKQIQEILVECHLKKLLSKENDTELFTLLIFKLMSNKEVSINFLMEKLIDEVLQNIMWLNFRPQLYLLTSYRIFLTENDYTNYSVFYNKIQKMVKLVDEDFSTANMHKLQLPELVDLLITFSYFGVGSSDFYLEIDKIIGKNINLIPPNTYIGILDAFVKTRNHREKFITLFQKKVLENKEKIDVDSLTKIMRIFASLKLSNETIFEKMQDYFLNLKHTLEDYEICDLVFSYSQLQMPNNFILSEMEKFIDHKSMKWMQKKKYDIIIDIADCYLLARKGEKEFIDNLKNILLGIHKEVKFEEINDISVFKLFHIFYLLNLPYDEIKFFDGLLRSKLKYYTRDEYAPLFSFLTKMEYKNEQTLEILKNLDSIGENNQEKIEYLKKYKLI